MLAKTIEGTRKNPRYLAHLSAVIDSDGNYDSGTILSMSELGCFVATDVTTRLGAVIQVSFQVPEFGRVKAHAVVIYHGHIQGHGGFGIKFLHPTAARDAVDAIRCWYEEYCWGDGLPE